MGGGREAGRSRRSRGGFKNGSAPSPLSPIRMDGWRQQAALTRGRSLPDVGDALHPNLRRLVERKVPSRLPKLGSTSDDVCADPVARRQAATRPAKELEDTPPKYRPSPWARSVTTKVDKRGKASEDHENVSVPWRRGYKANETQHLGMGKDLLSAEPMPGSRRPAPASAGRNYSLYVTYKNWVGPTCYTPMPSTRGSLSTRGTLNTAGSALHSRGSLVTPLGLTSAGSGCAGTAL